MVSKQALGEPKNDHVRFYYPVEGTFTFVKKIKKRIKRLEREVEGLDHGVALNIKDLSKELAELTERVQKLERRPTGFEVYAGGIDPHVLGRQIAANIKQHQTRVSSAQLDQEDRRR